MLTGRAFSRTLRGSFSAESTIFARTLSSAIREDFLTVSFQTYDQNRMNEMKKTENETASRMDETENNKKIRKNLGEQ